MVQFEFGFERHVTLRFRSRSRYRSRCI